MKRNKNNKFFSVLAFSVLAFSFAFSPGHSQASINKQINYQGKLTDPSGQAVADGNYDFVVKIYDSLSGGNLLWTGNYTSSNGNPVAVSGGIFTVLLGSGAGNTIDIDFSGSSYYLGVTVGSDDEMIPRKRLAAVPQAFNANNLIGDGYINITGTPTGTGVSQGTVYVNPDSAGSSDTLLGLAVNGSERMRVNGNGDLLLAGDLSVSTIKTASGDLTIDPSGNTIIKGSGTSSSSAALDVRDSSGGSLLYVRNDGSIGISNNSPSSSYKIDVTGAINATTGFYENGTKITSGSYWTLSGTDLYNNNSGNVGIGTNSPGSTLTVHSSSSGTVLAVRNTGDTANTFTISDTGAITSGTVNGQTISSSASFTGSVTVANSLSITSSTSQISGGGSNNTYGALTINGVKGAYGGLNFTDGATNLGTLMVSATDQGFYNNTDTGWSWYFSGGTLQAGTIPWARLSGVPSNLITGTGTTGYLARWTGTGTQGNSGVYDDGSGNIGIGTDSGTAKFTVAQTGTADIVNFIDNTTSIFKIADGGGITIAGPITYSGSGKPKRTIVLTAAGATTPTTGGATQTKVDGTNQTYYVLDYNDTTQNASFWQWAMPHSYDGGNIDVTLYWEAAATTGDVVWGVQTASVTANNNQSIDPSLGTAQTTTQTVPGSANTLASTTISNWSPSWSADGYIVFKAYRDAAAGADTMTGNARLAKIVIKYSVSSESD